MNQRSDIDRVMEVWMADGPTAIPDRVVDVVTARIGVQRQYRAWPLRGRANVNNQVKLAATLAAALVVAVAGFAILRQPTGSNVGGNPSSTPSPSPVASASPVPAVSPSPAPSVSAALPAWYTTSEAPTGAGILPAGSHTTRSFRPGFAFKVPNGWVNDGDSANFFSLFPDTPTNRAEFARSGALAQSIHMGPHNSPYFVCDAWEDNSGATAAEIVDAMLANEALDATGVVDVEIGGLTGKQVDVRLNPNWTEPCPGDPPGSDLGDLGITRGILLDSADRGVLVIFVGSLGPTPPDSEGFVDMSYIVESFEFDLGQ